MNGSLSLSASPLSASKSIRLFGLSVPAILTILIGVSTLARFYVATSLPLLPDEAYYFQWSKHLDASYVSKGPAIAYTIAAGTALWGPTLLGIRFFAVLLSAATAWQIFVLARLWFNEMTGLLAVLITLAVPIYNLGAVIMTIDPLSAFFWVWAANKFTIAYRSHHLGAWALSGLAVGCGFLAKYLNALELLSFAAFLFSSTAGLRHFGRSGFWVMLSVALLCMTPVFAWNGEHGWPTVANLASRANLENKWHLHIENEVGFLKGQALVVSPLLLSLLLGLALFTVFRRSTWRQSGEGRRFMILLFASVFLFYFVLAFHYVGEPNWPVISYFSLTILLADSWSRSLGQSGLRQVFSKAIFGLAFLLGLIETVALHSTPLLPIKGRNDPMSRFVGWSQLAQALENERKMMQDEGEKPLLIADAYKEASILSFYLPDQAFIYTRRPNPVFNSRGEAVAQRSSQFDLWPSYEGGPRCALYLTEDPSGGKVSQQFSERRCLEEIAVSYRGALLRRYFLFLCQNRTP